MAIAACGEKMFFAASDGLRLRYSVISGRGLPIILHHGFASSAREEWIDRGVVDALAVLGRPMVLFDARGHGDSDAPHESSAYGERRLALDVTELAAEVGDQVDVVAYSMGSVASLLAASTSTGLIRRIAVGGVGSGIVQVGGLDSRVLNPKLLAAAFSSSVSDEQAPDLAAWRDAATARGADVLALAALADSLLIDGIDLTAITQEVLVYAGLSDFLADQPEILCRALAHSSLLIVPGDHDSTLHSRMVTRAIVEFLR